MKGKLEKEGNYELFETNHGHDILVLNDNDYFAIIDTSQGHLLVDTDSDHKKDHTIDKGKFYLADFEDDPSFKDMPHLFLKEGKKYKEFILPNDLPSESDTQKKLVETDDKLGKQKVMNHVKASGNKGNEKQYEGKKENLWNKSKEDLYEMAKKKDISGRSEMDKKQLVNAIEKKK